MLYLDRISSDTLQKHTFLLPDNTSLDVTLYFVPLQLSWVIRELSYGDFKLNGLRISNSPNMLHQFKNQLPFGLACFSSEEREPSQQQDFSSGNSKLYILTALEVQQYAEFLSG